MDFALIKIFLIVIGFTVGILLTAFLTIYFQWPSLLIKIAIRFKRWQTGVEVKYATFKDYRFCYFCRGKPGPQPAMLMLHGFSVSKDMWLGTVELFPKDLHFICLDMPGHGESIHLQGEESYTAAAQVERVHQFVECTGLNQKPFHLVGMSMGGMIAGTYAAWYPSEVCCLSFMCPAGLQYGTENEVAKQLLELSKTKSLCKIPCLPLTVKEVEETMALSLYHVPKNVNKQFMQGFLDYQIPHYAIFKKCLLDCISEESRYTLLDNMSKIKAPTQIIWGMDDKITDPSGGEILAASIPNSQLHMLEKCGHFMMMDRPKESAKLLVEFHNSVCGKVEAKKSI
ncbi:monoacylglycerol lipase ABHD6-like [Podarcis raffonei]|uniref:monoacylglycerol lipase ABHD6-like n=1 Tax=Podarcis raffonei TaxID=65483 RepID=UPI0023296B02|nr:monoacylglycerol lipase ABHD6-like [Podarcis raffonei]